MPMQPLPIPVEFVGKIVNDVPQVDGTIPKQMCVLEFITVTGVAVYFFDKQTLKSFISGMQDLRDKMTENGSRLHLAKEMPHA